MHGPWIEKLSDHMDGLLSEVEALELRAHLDGCAECRSVEAELRAVAAAAADMTARDSEREPPRDLWPGILSRLDAARPDELLQAASHDAGGVNVSGIGLVMRRARRFSFSVPQLAAAAVVLMALSGAVVWTLTRSAQPAGVAAGTIIQSAGDSPPSSRLVSTAPTADYTYDVAELERALEQNSAQLDPVTVDVIRRSLETINSAIADARSALEADPNNPYLVRQLDNTMRKKIDVLQRAAGVRRAQS